MEAAGAEQQLEEARHHLRAASAVVALTGAGISTDAGIADFRGPKGIWTLNPGAERFSSLQHYLSDDELRRASWRSRLDAPVWTARPTAGHLALVELERRRRLRTIVTQNTDGLHQLAGSLPANVVEVHGTTHWTICWACGHRQPTLKVLERVRAGDDDPRCSCGGILKTATVSFGQSLDPDVLARAQQAAAEADLLLAVGTTLEVQPVAGIVPLAARLGATIIIVNGSPTAADSIADVVLRGQIGELLPALVAADGDGPG
jgi:NAD-dependent deacetylase